MSMTLTQRQEGGIWSAIRSELTYCREEIKRAAEAQSYEAESAQLDAIARKLGERVVRDLTGDLNGPASTHAQDVGREEDGHQS